MNLKFIEGGKAGHKVIKFRGVGVANKKVVYGKGEREFLAKFSKIIQSPAL